MLYEVTCMCGFQARGAEDDIVDQIQAHGAADHGSVSTREQIMAMAVPVGGGPAPGASDA